MTGQRILHYRTRNHTGLPSQKIKDDGVVFLLVFVFIAGWACRTHQPGSDSNPSSVQMITRPIFYPEEKGPSPAVLVLPPAGSQISAHADDVARKLAREGYVARAVSYGVRTSGKVLSDSNSVNRLMRLVSDNLTSLKMQPGVDPKRIGIIAYSLGGFFATHLAANIEENGLRAVVIYYGLYPLPELTKILRVPVLAFQGNADSYREFVEQALAMQRIAQENHRQFDLVIYRDAGHGFDYDSSPAFNGPAAVDAWEKTIAFLNQNMKR